MTGERRLGGPGPARSRDRARALEEIARHAGSDHDRTLRAERIASIVRKAGGYRWVGIYDVGGEEIGIVGWSGPAAPTYPRFPVSQGLNGAAVRSGATVIAGDVASDPRYLTTLGSTRSEIVVPVKDPETGAVVGTIDAESEHADAFMPEDQAFLEACGRTAAPLWNRSGGLSEDRYGM